MADRSIDLQSLVSIIDELIVAEEEQIKLDIVATQSHNKEVAQLEGEIEEQKALIGVLRSVSEDPDLYWEETNHLRELRETHKVMTSRDKTPYDRARLQMLKRARQKLLAESPNGSLV